jgi:hypothetical protein
MALCWLDGLSRCVPQNHVDRRVCAQSQRSSRQPGEVITDATPMSPAWEYDRPPVESLASPKSVESDNLTMGEAGVRRMSVQQLSQHIKPVHRTRTGQFNTGTLRFKEQPPVKFRTPSLPRNRRGPPAGLFAMTADLGATTGAS